MFDEEIFILSIDNESVKRDLAYIFFQQLIIGLPIKLKDVAQHAIVGKKMHDKSFCNLAYKPHHEAQAFFLFYMYTGIKR